MKVSGTSPVPPGDTPLRGADTESMSVGPAPGAGGSPGSDPTPPPGATCGADVRGDPNRNGFRHSGPGSDRCTAISSNRTACHSSCAPVAAPISPATPPAGITSATGSLCPPGTEVGAPAPHPVSRTAPTSDTQPPRTEGRVAVGTPQPSQRRILPHTLLRPQWPLRPVQHVGRRVGVSLLRDRDGVNGPWCTERVVTPDVRPGTGGALCRPLRPPHASGSLTAPATTAVDTAQSAPPVPKCSSVADFEHLKGTAPAR